MVSGTSTPAYLLDFFCGTLDNWDNNISSGAIYLDFQKEFDNVLDDCLLRKLHSAGTGDNLTGWMMDWLTWRNLRVLLGCQNSQAPITSDGGPQGSVLGYILVVIKDLEIRLKFSVSRLAYDTKVGGKILTMVECDIIQMDVDGVV